MAIQIQFRHDAAANWTAANPVLASGEPGYETDTGKFKVGDGMAAWTSLSYSSGTMGPTGAAGSPGATGEAGATGATGYSPQWIVASGAPGAGLGENGDMYVNSATSDVYGPKSGGAWGAIVANIKGSSAGLPSAGAANQALTKIDAATGNVQWSTIDKTFVGLGNVTNAAQVTTAQMGAASGVATLDASSRVVQTPAVAGQASGLATLDANAHVVQAPASAGLASGLATLNAAGLVVQNTADLNAGLSTDGAFAANSDSLVPSQKATATFVAAQLANASSVGSTLYLWNTYGR